MNIAAVIILTLGLILAIAGFVIMGLPALVTAVGDTAVVGEASHNFAMYKNGFTDIFAGLQKNFKNFFNFKLMFESAKAQGTSLYFYIVVGILAVSAILLIVHFILMCVHKKGRAIGPGLLFIVTAFVSYILLVLFLVPVPAGRTFEFWSIEAADWRATTEYVDANNPGDFLTIINAIQTGRGGWAANALNNTKFLIVLPFVLVALGYLFGLIGFILSMVDAGHKKTTGYGSKNGKGGKMQMLYDEEGNPVTVDGPIQIVVKNAPASDRVVVIPSPMPAPRPAPQPGPRMVQYINTQEETEEEPSPYATPDDVKKAIHDELASDKERKKAAKQERQEAKPAPAPEKVTVTEDPYLTEEEAKKAVHEAVITHKKGSK